MTKEDFIKIEKGDFVQFGGLNFYEVAGKNLSIGMIEIYDEPPSKHVDSLNYESIKSFIKKQELKDIEDSLIIKAEFIRESRDSFYLDCEGDPVWFPKKEVNFYPHKQELECPRWLLKKQFPNDNF